MIGEKLHKSDAYSWPVHVSEHSVLSLLSLLPLELINRTFRSWQLFCVLLLEDFGVVDIVVWTIAFWQKRINKPFPPNKWKWRIGQKKEVIFCMVKYSQQMVVCQQFLCQFTASFPFKLLLQQSPLFCYFVIGDWLCPMVDQNVLVVFMCSSIKLSVNSTNKLWKSAITFFKTCIISGNTCSVQSHSCSSIKQWHPYIKKKFLLHM